MGMTAISGGNLYLCVASNGNSATAPTTTADYIVDGNIAWKYLGTCSSLSPVNATATAIYNSTNNLTVDNLVVGGGATGIVNYPNNPNALTLNVSNNVTVNSGGTFSCGTQTNDVTHLLNVGGSITNNGTFTTITTAGTKVLDVTMNGTGTQTINSSINFNNLTIVPNSKVTNSGTLTAASFTIQSDATGTGSYIDNGTSTITSAKAQQYLTGANTAGTINGRFWYMTTPVGGSTSNAFVPATNNLWSYDESGNTLAAVYSKITTTDVPLTPGTGYVARMANSGNISLEGTSFFNADLPFTDLSWSSTDATKKGFHLIGNPYPCYLDITPSFAAGPAFSGFETTAWYRSSSDGTTNVFDTFNARTGTSIINNSGSNLTTLAIIPPMQAFWVRATSGANSLTLSKANRSHKPTNGNNLRSASTIDAKQIRLNVSNGTSTDQTLIGFYAEASDEFENCDSRKMFNGVATLPEIYSLSGTTQVAINGLPQTSDTKEIVLGFKTTQAGSFTIKAAEILNLEADQTVILKDKLQDVSQNLTEQPVYSFTSDAVNTTSRFSLVIGKMATVLNSIQKAKFDVRTMDGGQLEIALDGATIANVKVFDTVGRLVFAQDIQSQVSSLSKAFSKGVYLVKVTIDGVENNKKVVVNL